MERPNHLKVEEKSAGSKATSIAIVIAIHIAGIAGLVAALAQGALMKQLQEIKASVDTQKTPPKAPPPPPPQPPSHAISNDPLRPIMRTHTQPPYPPISQRLGEQGTTLIEVGIGTDGNVSECSVVKGSGSDRLDGASCDWVKGHWRWQPPTLNGAPTAAKTQINVTWNLKDAK
jgi:periplasmic protein TonB